MSTSRNSHRIGAKEGPRMAWQRVRARIYKGVQHDGYSDLNPAHVALFRFETIDGRRPSQIAESTQITKQSVNDLIRHLDRHGYAQFLSDPSDRRARLIQFDATRTTSGSSGSKICNRRREGIGTRAGPGASSRVTRHIAKDNELSS